MKRHYFILSLLYLLGLQGVAQTAQQRQDLSRYYNSLQGVAFPGLYLEDTSGTIISTSSLKGKTIYVDFWFTLCPPCLREIPYAQSLQQFFASDTNVVFLNICIENIDRKDAWKKMIKEKHIGGINLFYARNRPQKVNLLRQYMVNDFPTYMIVNAEHTIIGYDAPAPSEKYWVHWALYQATKNVSLAEAYRKLNSPEYFTYKESIKAEVER